MSPLKYDIAVDTGRTSGNSTLVTVTVPLSKEEQARAPEAIQILQGMPLREELSVQLPSKFKLPRGGLVPAGGPNPKFKDDDRTKGLVGYTRDFKWTAGI
jgi:hypothetical protein